MVRIRLKEILEERKISMGKLARMSDVSFSTIRRLCNDEDYSPTLNILERVSRALDVPIGDLYEVVQDEDKE